MYEKGNNKQILEEKNNIKKEQRGLICMFLNLCIILSMSTTLDSVIETPGPAYY